jgi:hypothetical protein
LPSDNLFYRVECLATSASLILCKRATRAVFLLVLHSPLGRRRLTRGEGADGQGRRQGFQIYESLGAPKPSIPPPPRSSSRQHIHHNTLRQHPPPIHCPLVNSYLLLAIMPEVGPDLQQGWSCQLFSYPSYNRYTEIYYTLPPPLLYRQISMCHVCYNPPSPHCITDESRLL